jgi:aminocarboxymuconate-semialdehyde decarboxylase
MPVIDMHTHALSKRVEPLIAGRYDPMDIPYRRAMSPASRDTEAEQGRLLSGLMLDVVRRREMMRRQAGPL